MALTMLGDINGITMVDSNYLGLYLRINNLEQARKGPWFAQKVKFGNSCKSWYS